MRPGPENSYVHNIDRGPLRQPERPEGQGDAGHEAEEVVISFFESNFPELGARAASPEEDRGHTGIDSGKQVDVVLDRDGRPEAALQVTTAQDSVVRQKKMLELKAKPFVRLEGMTVQDTSVPKILVFVEADEVRKFLANAAWELHPKLALQILTSMENSLRFDLLSTKNPKELARAQETLALVLARKQELAAGAGQAH